MIEIDLDNFKSNCIKEPKNTIEIGLDNFKSNCIKEPKNIIEFGLDKSKSENENDSVTILTKKLDSVNIFGHISEEKKNKIYYFNTKNVMQKKKVRPTGNTKNQKKLNEVQNLLDYYGEDNQHLQNEIHLLKIGLNAYEVEKIIEIFKLMFNDDIIKLKNNTITHYKGNWPKNEFKIESIQRLQTGQWLNDDIIDTYYKSLRERDYNLFIEKKNIRQSLFFDIHYLITLYFFNEKYNFNAVLEIYHKTEEQIDQLKNVFEMDKIFFPVHKDKNHFSLIVIYVQQKRINYYDSISSNANTMKFGNDMMDNIILMWLTDVAVKFNILEFNSAHWKKTNTDRFTVPQQVGGCDCGIFCIMFTDYLSNNLSLKDNVIQKYVPYFRILIAITYLNQKLVY
jgi:sentrin-specific protease 1